MKSYKTDFLGNGNPRRGEGLRCNGKEEWGKILRIVTGFSDIRGVGKDFKDSDRFL